jgi:hypothetical protein
MRISALSRDYCYGNIHCINLCLQTVFGVIPVTNYQPDKHHLYAIQIALYESLEQVYQ